MNLIPKPDYKGELWHKYFSSANQPIATICFIEQYIKATGCCDCMYSRVGYTGLCKKCKYVLEYETLSFYDWSKLLTFMQIIQHYPQYIEYWDRSKHKYCTISISTARKIIKKIYKDISLNLWDP
tara:strand:+ start:3433 stop:3807 length:375 start_codon:yes stop_codon:yes gene_type:complete